jgi:hypothetical protein
MTPLNRITVKVTTACGDHWFTEINATLDEARRYFMGQRFERHDETMREPVVSVELVAGDEQ